MTFGREKLYSEQTARRSRISCAGRRWRFRGSIDPVKLVEARYEKGLLKPTKPLALRPGERVNLIVVRRPDPNRWDLDRLQKTASVEDMELAERGLVDWSARLDEEDQ